MRKPFYKKSHKVWYVHHNGKLEKLSRTEEEANKVWAKLLDEQEPAAPQATGLSLGELVDRFLAWVKRHRADGTYLSYRN